MEGAWGVWLRARARLAPGLPWQGLRGFEDGWAPVRALAQRVRCLPPQLAERLLEFEGGFVVIAAGECRYQPGPVALRHGVVLNVASVSVEHLSRGDEHPLHAIGHLVDHYLGCGGRPVGPWLSEGGGLGPAWQQAGRRLARLFELGYGVDPLAQSGVRNYFAQSLACFCQDRQVLNTADPQVVRWLRSTLWDAAFWSR
jgi:hypothetical protein